MRNAQILPTSGAFVAASWVGLLVGTLGFCAGLWNAAMQLNERGYYFAVLLLGLYSAVSLQKAVRDRLEDIPVTNIYFGLSWIAVGAAIFLMTVGLWNADLALSEKGFYGMAFLMSMYAAIAVQKNIRDRALFNQSHPTSYEHDKE